ncbi:transposable element Tcb1 transposase [Trichonephila clavipes]|nr:transposable element Tcb1 transposase [Trichonephila clavipes]
MPPVTPVVGFSLEHYTGCIATSVRNFDQKSSGRPDSGAAWNFFRSGRFLARHASSWQLQIFQEIGSRVGRNQTTVLRICDRSVQESTTDRRGRSHPPQRTTSREDRQIVRMEVTDRSVTSRTVAQHIESVTHYSVSARTIRRRLQQSGLSARRPLLGLSTLDAEPQTSPPPMVR